MPDIFISYSRADEPYALRMAEVLSGSGFDVWWDNHLRSGEDWDQAIERALRNAKAVIVLWSPESVTSRWVRAEATVAQRLGTLVPAMIADCDMPIVFQMIQTADLSHWSGDPQDHAWKRFLSDISAKIAPTTANQKTHDAAPAAASSGERRSVTALACNLSFGTESIDDPEDHIEIVSAAHQALRAALTPFGAQVLNGHGESLTALFGMSGAREDDAIRCVDAAFAATEAISKLAENEGLTLAVHCGLRTGTMVVQDQTQAPLGGVIDDAHRLVSQASEGEILVCTVTQHLIEGYFPVSQTSRGEWRVDGPHAAETRFELSRNRGLSSFVGRENELSILRDARANSVNGQGKVVSLSAEAGSGKSRLSHEFKLECLEQGMIVIEGSAKVNSGGSALTVVLELFRSLFGLTGEEIRELGQATVEEWIEQHEPGLDSALPLLLEFLSLAPTDAEPTGLDPQVRQRQLVGLFRHLISILGRHNPILILVEDLHWLDESSAQFLNQVVEGHARSNALMLLNYRPEFQASWVQGSHCQQISLQPLGEEDVGSLLVSLMGDDPTTEGLHQPILARTKGNPFFIEEIVRNLAQAGELEGEKGSYRFTGNAAALRIPDTVKAVLAARLDRLSPGDRAVLQAASIIGKDFDEPLLAKLCEIDGLALNDALANLQRAEFIDEKEIFPVQRFSFHHPLTQETASANLLRKDRKRLHATIAKELSQGDENKLDENAASIAMHWEAAGKNAEAIAWYARAAEWSVATDYSIAISNWQKVRKLIGPKPADMELLPLAIGANIQLLNLNFRVAVDLALGEALLEEGKALAEMAGDKQLELQQRMMFSRIQCGAGDLSGYLSNARKNLAAAQAAGDDGLTLVGTVMLIDACNYSCRFDEVIEIADAGCAKYPHDLPRDAWATGFNPHTFFHFMRGAAFGWQGKYQAMLDQFEHTYDLTQKDATPEVTCWLLFLRSVFATAAGDRETAWQSTSELRELSDKAGVPLNVAHRHLTDADYANFDGKFDDAIAAVEKAHPFFDMLERQWKAFALMLHARALLGKGALSEAQDMGQAAYESAIGKGVHQIAAGGLIVVARARMQAENPINVSEIKDMLSEAEQLIAESTAHTLDPFLTQAREELAAANN